MNAVIRQNFSLIAFALLASSLAAVGFSVKKQANTWLMETSRNAGLVLSDMQISGLIRTSETEIFSVLDVDNGMPLLSIDLEVIQQRVESLPWVKQAEVSRILPEGLSIRVTERVPYALSQRDGQISLIDPDGVSITDRGLGKFSHLMLVVGDVNANILRQLEREKAKSAAIGAQIKSAVRVGGRRWDLIFENGIRVKLPAEQAQTYGMAAAWSKFIELNEKHKLLAREVSVIDMRYPDRLVVRVTPVGRRTMTGEEWAL